MRDDGPNEALSAPPGTASGGVRRLVLIAWIAAGIAFIEIARLLAAPVPQVALAAAGAALALLGFMLAWRRKDDEIRRLAGEAERLSNLLHVDQLTGLMNRVAFHARLEQVVKEEQEALVVLFFDLDRFKEVNDTLGHRAGDDLLRQVAERARQAVPEPIALARLGGDEFAAVLRWNFSDRVEHYGELIAAAMGRPFDIDGKRIEIAASIGLAMGDPALCSGSELLRRADLAMYAAKSSPKERVRLFDEALDRRETRESSVRIELKRAMIEDLFALHYQPIVDARSGGFKSAEALLRPQSTTLRDVNPSALISIAEASGQINALTDWTLETALGAAARLDGPPVAVNISPHYFRQPEFVTRMIDKLLAARVRPEQLTVEVTENVLIENIEAARHSLNRLREIGIKVFLDDFGTGYSSLSYLQHFELDGLKLDKSFLRAVGDRRKTNQIIRSVIDFGHSLDMLVVVEGVESDWQARLLQLLGCDLLQGFEIGMPMPLDDLLAFREARRSIEAEERPAEGSVDAGSDDKGSRAA